jgi:uncharacterized protein YegJ (DUF2314 family)
MLPVLLLSLSIAALAAEPVVSHDTSASAGAHIFPAGDPRQDPITFEYAIYCLPECQDIEQHLAQQAQRIAPGLHIFKELPPKLPPGALVWAHLQTDIAQNYAPPDMRSLAYFGRGLSREQAEQVQNSQQALVLNFAHTKADVWKSLRTASELTEAVARSSHGLIWDEDARLLYTPDAWHEKRIAGWSMTIPDVWNRISIHSYKHGDYVRAITLGMAEFGLPDIVVDQFSWADDRGIGNLINGLAQALAEGAQIGAGGSYDLDLHALRNPAARERALRNPLHGATAAAHLQLLIATPDEGDPRNRLLEISFDRYPGRDARARQDALLSSMFGATDEVAHVKHDDELLAASRKARARLPALRAAFAAGFGPGEFLEVKVPFEVPDGGREWMWVEISAWSSDGTIRGLLRNEPEQVPDLHAGETVQVAESDVFDYLLQHADGTREGNETSALIQRMQQH